MFLFVPGALLLANSYLELDAPQLNTEVEADAMQILSTRFGVLEVDADDLITFPAGLLGMRDCRHWILLADGHNDAVAWLQSTSRPDVALAVVSPRRFVPDYQVGVTRNELFALEMNDLADAQVLAIVGRNESGMTLNLKAPLLVNVERRLGRQVVSTVESPLQYELNAPEERMPLRKSA